MIAPGRADLLRRLPVAGKVSWDSPCPGGCDHTEAEHSSFDHGVAVAKGGYAFPPGTAPAAPGGVPDPEAWRIGYLAERAEGEQTAARAAGARRHWVSKDGYTQLPPEMREQMGLDQAGGHIWFLPDGSGPAWKAWKEEDLDAVFGDRGGPSEE